MPFLVSVNSQKVSINIIGWNIEAERFNCLCHLLAYVHISNYFAMLLPKVEKIQGENNMGYKREDQNIIATSSNIQFRV